MRAQRDEPAEISVEPPVEMPGALPVVTEQRRKKTSSTMVRAGASRRAASLASRTTPQL